jgi:3-dehydroquinate synthetase
MGEKSMTHIRVKVGAGYDVVIDKGIDFGAALKERLKKARKIAVVSDDTVFGLYGKRVGKSLESAGFEVFSYVFKNGETSKSADEYVKILEFLAGAGLTRTDALAALGGGVTGDLGGFAAATYLRGIRFVQLPTTLLAAVDSSVGGKTGINLSVGKNLAGAFHQPSAVLCDIGFLETLSEDLIADGMGEIIKHAVLKGGELLDELEKPFDEKRGIEPRKNINFDNRKSGIEPQKNINFDDGKRGIDPRKNTDFDGEKFGVESGKNELLKCGKNDIMSQKNEVFKCGKNGADGENFSYDWGKIIALSVAVKAEFVERDEKERDVRRLLNLGHTVGHAVEKLSGYKIRHGKCVAAGLLYIAELSYIKGFLSVGAYNRILKLLSKNGLDIDLPYNISDMMSVIRSDKKMSGETLSLVVIRDIGDCRIEEIPIEKLNEFFRI